MRRGFLKALLGIAAAPFVKRAVDPWANDGMEPWVTSHEPSAWTIRAVDDRGEVRRVVSTEEHIMTIDRAFDGATKAPIRLSDDLLRDSRVNLADLVRKGLVLAFLVLAGGLWPDRAQAQVCAAEAWTLNPDGTECTTSNRGRLDTNKETCARFGLAAGDTDATQCSQAAACGAPAIPGFPACAGGSGCSAAQAIACGRRIYPDSTVGRQQWAGVAIVRPALDAVKERHAPPPPTGSDFRAYCLNFWIPALQTTRDQECSKSGLPPQCNICPLSF